jgi:outer membrane protein TolC
MSSGHVSALTLGLVFAFAAGCKSSETLRKEADDDVRLLVESRRAKLSLDDGSFTIDPNPQSLRQRILRGELKSTEPLTLITVLDIAAENSREYQRRKEALYLDALDLTLERWRFGIQPDATVDAAVAGVGSEAKVATVNPRLHFDKLLGTGAKIVGDIGLNFARALTFSESGFHDNSSLFFSITQPLLRGAGSLIVEEPLTQAERDVFYAVRTFERFRRGFAVDVATRYYRLAQGADAIANQERNYESLVELRQRNEELARAGRLSDIDVGQARQDELRSKNSLLEERERFANLEDDFKLFLGLPVDTQLVYPTGVLAELSALGLQASQLEEEASVAYALVNRLDHLNLVDAQADAERRVRITADALRAGLDLRAEWGALSGTEDALNYDFDKAAWSLSAALDLPIDQLPARNTYRQALIEFDVAARQAEQSVDQIRADLRQELRGLASQTSSYEIQQNAVALAERRIESTQLKLEAGRADTRDLLEAQSALLDAQNAATNALVEYTLGQLALYRDLELLRVDETGLHADEALIQQPLVPQAPVQPNP